MSTFVVIGAGPGLGAASARRFGREGFDVALVARHRERVEGLAAELAEEGLPVQGFVADASEPATLTAVLDEITATLGPVEVVQYSPAPAREFMLPVLETTVDDLLAPVRMAVHGPVTVVRHLLPGMRERGRGTVLFVNGGSAMTPRAAVAGTSIAYAGESAYAQMLHETLRDDGVHVAQLVVPGAIVPGDPDKAPAVLADLLWSMHVRRDGFRTVAGG